MVLYVLYINVKETPEFWSVGIEDAIVNVNGTLGGTDINGDVVISGNIGGVLDIYVNKPGYLEYHLHEDYHDQDFIYFIELQRAECIPQLKCELDANNNNTGFMLDGCGGRIEDLLNCPLPVTCSQITCTLTIE